jgi:hypothetical protein
MHSTEAFLSVGYLLVFDASDVDTESMREGSESEQLYVKYRDRTESVRKKVGASEDDLERIEQMNNRGKSVIKQMAPVLQRLQESKFIMVQNYTEKLDAEGNTVPDKFYIRIRMVEEDLMEAAEEMNMMKKVKRVYIPDNDGQLQNGSDSYNLPKPVVGGWLPYTMARANGYNHHSEDGARNLRLPLAIAGRNKPGLVETKDITNKDKNASATDYDGGIYIMPQTFPNDEGLQNNSMFTQAQALEIMMWCLQKKTGLDIEYTDADACSGKIELWKKSVLEDGSLGYPDLPNGLLFFTNLSPIHSPRERQLLLRDWGPNVLASLFTFKGFFSCEQWLKLRQPTAEIKNYFGQQVALYFDFVGFFLRFLAVPSIFCIVLYSIALANYDPSEIEHSANTTAFAGVKSAYRHPVIVPLYSISVIVWATVMMECWKRRDHMLSLQWGTAGFKWVPTYRKPWLKNYEELHGTDNPDDISPFKAEAMSRLFIEVQSDPKACTGIGGVRYGMAFRKTASALSVTLFAICVLAIVFGILFLRLIYTVKQDSTGVLLTACLNGFAITVISVVYTSIAKTLTKWENHATDVDHENALIAKTYALEFINNYISLFYIAFVKPFAARRLAKQLIDPEEYGGNSAALDLTARCYEDDCMYELMIQLAMILLMKATVIKGAYMLMDVLRRMWTNKQTSKTVGSDDVVWYIYEDTLADATPVLDDYKEIAIYYGHVVLFAAAFPIAPVIALFVVETERRTDALRLLCSKRPQPKTVANIGAWYLVLETITYIAVATNCGIIFFTSHSLIDEDAPNAWLYKVVAFIITEHLMIGFRLLLEFAIPDETSKTINLLYQEKEKFEWLHRTIKYKDYNGGWRFGQWASAQDKSKTPNAKKYGLAGSDPKIWGKLENSADWVWHDSSELGSPEQIAETVVANCKFEGFSTADCGLAAGAAAYGVILQRAAAAQEDGAATILQTEVSMALEKQRMSAEILAGGRLSMPGMDASTIGGTRGAEVVQRCQAIATKMYQNLQQQAAAADATPPYQLWNGELPHDLARILHPMVQAQRNSAQVAAFVKGRWAQVHAEESRHRSKSKREAATRKATEAARREAGKIAKKEWSKIGAGNAITEGWSLEQDMQALQTAGAEQVGGKLHYTPLHVAEKVAGMVARLTVLQRAGSRVEATQAARAAVEASKEDETLPGIDVETTLEYAAFASSKSWRWHNEGKMHFVDELNDVCNPKDPDYQPPGQSCLSKQEMNKLDLDQLMDSEWQMRYGDQNGEDDDDHDEDEEDTAFLASGFERQYLLRQRNVKRQQVKLRERLSEMKDKQADLDEGYEAEKTERRRRHEMKETTPFNREGSDSASAGDRSSESSEHHRAESVGLDTSQKMDFQRAIMRRMPQGDSSMNNSRRDDKFLGKEVSDEPTGLKAVASAVQATVQLIAEVAPTSGGIELNPLSSDATSLAGTTSASDMSVV